VKHAKTLGNFEKTHHFPSDFKFSAAGCFLARRKESTLQLVDEFYRSWRDEDRCKVIDCLQTDDRVNKRGPVGYGDILVIPRGKLVGVFLLKVLEVCFLENPN
jgi:hypothetical protein